MGAASWEGTMDSVLVPAQVRLLVPATSALLPFINTINFLHAFHGFNVVLGCLDLYQRMFEKLGRPPARLAPFSVYSCLDLLPPRQTSCSATPSLPWLPGQYELYRT